MDITAFSSDIDELVEAFVEINGLELSQMKELWRSRSFGFIHEARLPQVTIAFFMQALYSCALEYLKGDLPWSKKLGGLYMLYILYETQLPVPTIKIYLSTDDLENIYSLVLEAKANGPLTALRVVNRMMVRDSFLYGSVTVTGKKMKESFRELSSRATEHVQRARKRLFASSSATRHFEGNLIKDLGLDELALLNQEYEVVKQRVYKGAAEIDQDDYDSLGPIFGDELKKDVHSWLEDMKCLQGQDGAELQGQEKASRMYAENEKGVTSEQRESGQHEEWQDQDNRYERDDDNNDYVFEEELQELEKGSGMDGGADDEVFEIESQDQENGLGMDGGAGDEVFEVESRDQEKGLELDGGGDDDVFRFELESVPVGED